MIADWIKASVEGSGGLLDFERREWAARNDTAEIVAASWIIRCLANPRNQGSQEVLEAIIAQREKVYKENPLLEKKCDRVGGCLKNIFGPESSCKCDKES